MNARETIQSWRWRIVKAGHNTRSFANLLDMSPSIFCEYFKGTKSPSIERFDVIENKLREMGV